MISVLRLMIMIGTLNDGRKISCLRITFYPRPMFVFDTWLYEFSEHIIVPLFVHILQGDVASLASRFLLIIGLNDGGVPYGYKHLVFTSHNSPPVLLTEDNIRNRFLSSTEPPLS